MLPTFFAVVVLLTWLEWDFLHGTGWTVMDEHQVNYPSTLALGDLGLLQSLNFVVLSALALVFGQGLRTQFAHRRSGAVATGGLAAVAASGLFSMFFTDLPGGDTTWHGLLHGIGFLLLMLGSAVAFVASGLALRGPPAWQGYRVFSLATLPLAAVVTVAATPLGQVAFYLLVTVMLAWFAVMGFRLRQLAGSATAGQLRDDPSARRQAH
jgi:hypothetical protein